MCPGGCCNAAEIAPGPRQRERPLAWLDWIRIQSELPVPAPHAMPRRIRCRIPAGETSIAEVLSPRAGESLWIPNATRPSWLDGSLPGDRGFDPLGLAKPTEYLQVGAPLLFAPHTRLSSQLLSARRI